MEKKMFYFMMVASFLTSGFNVFGQEQVPVPAFKDGDFWQFKVTEKDFIAYSSEALDGTYELVYSQGKVKIFKLTDDKKVELDPKPDSATDHLQVLLGLSQERQDLRFPLSVGQKWIYTYDHRAIGGRRERSRSVEISVTGIEQVTTPAGTFRAFKITKDEGRRMAWGRERRNAAS